MITTSRKPFLGEYTEVVGVRSMTEVFDLAGAAAADPLPTATVASTWVFSLCAALMTALPFKFAVDL